MHCGRNTVGVVDICQVQDVVGKLLQCERAQAHSRHDLEFYGSRQLVKTPDSLGKKDRV